MAIKKILVFPEPRLRQVSKEVTDFNDGALPSIINDLFETMENAAGIGLAAIQIGVPLRIAVINVEKPLTIINPKIKTSSAQTQTHEEGCLSMPGIRSEVKRPQSIQVSAKDIDGKSFTIQAEELLATCLQHEIDHMDGKLFIDRISPWRRSSLNTEIRALIASHQSQNTS